MIFGYESLLMKFRENSEEKVKSAVIGMWFGDTLIVVALAIVITFFLSLISNPILFLVMYFLLLFSIVFYISTRRASLALTKNNFVYIKFTHLFYKVKEVYEIPFENIKDVKLNKLFGVTSVVISFISNDKKFKRIRFKFSSLVLGMSAQKNNSKKIYEKLREIEKVMDRGDF